MKKSLTLISLPLLSFGLASCGAKEETISAKTFFQTAQKAEEVTAKATSFGYELKDGNISYDMELAQNNTYGYGGYIGGNYGPGYTFQGTGANVENNSDTSSDTFTASNTVKLSAALKDLNINCASTSFNENDTVRKASYSFKTNASYSVNGSFINSKTTISKNDSASIDMGVYVEDTKTYVNINNSASLNFLNTWLGTYESSGSFTSYTSFDNAYVQTASFSPEYITDLLTDIENVFNNLSSYSESEQTFLKTLFTFTQSNQYSYLTLRITNDNKIQAFDALVKAVEEEDSDKTSDTASSTTTGGMGFDWEDYVKPYGEAFLNAIDFRSFSLKLALNDKGYSYLDTNIDLGVSGSGNVEVNTTTPTGASYKMAIARLSSFNFKVSMRQNYGYGVQVQDKGEHDYVDLTSGRAMSDGTEKEDISDEDNTSSREETEAGSSVNP